MKHIKQASFICSLKFVISDIGYCDNEQNDKLWH